MCSSFCRPLCICVHTCVCLCVFTPVVCQSEWSLGIAIFLELTVTSGTACALLWIFIYFLFNHVFVDHLRKILQSYYSEWGSKTQRVSLVNNIRAIIFHKDVANLASVLLIGFVIFVSLFLSFLCGLVCLHSCEDLETAWQEEMQVRHDLFNYACV